jgi:hypothetical protein
MASYAIDVTTTRAADDQREPGDMAKKPARLTREMVEYHPSKLSREEALARIEETAGCIELTAPMPPLKRLLGIPARPRLDLQSSKKATAEGAQGDRSRKRLPERPGSGEETQLVAEEPAQLTDDDLEYHPRTAEDPVARVRELSGIIELTGPMPPLKRLLGIPPLPKLDSKSSKRARD